MTERKKALIVGGTSGIGLSIALKLVEKDYEKIYILGRNKPEIITNIPSIKFIKFNLINEDYSIFSQFADITTLVISAGFGRVAPFENIQEIEIVNQFKVNTVSTIRILKKFYNKLIGNDDFYCAVIGSIAGYISSPLFSVYGATKASICKFVESINIELEMKGSSNRILNISPGSIKGTKFNNSTNNINLTLDLAENILKRMFARDKLYIPNYKKTYKGVLERYYNNPHDFGVQSYEYKMKSGRLNKKPQVRIGYLSGTFDLFHIGHLNLLRRAKKYCDYLVVGVHKDGSHKKKDVYIPFDERVEIIKSIKYVDEVIESLPEDDEVYKKIKYNFLFVGDDYKGTERFNKYEKYFKDKDVQIIYFPYTKGTSSTQLRSVIEKSNKDVATSLENA